MVGWWRKNDTAARARAGRARSEKQTFFRRAGASYKVAPPAPAPALLGRRAPLGSRRDYVASIRRASGERHARAMQVCAACSHVCPRDDFSHRQYAKAVGVSRCSRCVALSHTALPHRHTTTNKQHVKRSRAASDVEVSRRRINAARQHNFEAPLLQLTHELKLAVVCASLSREPLEVRWGPSSKESVLQRQRLNSRDLGRFQQISTDMWFDSRARAMVETAAQALVAARLDGHTSRAERRGKEGWLHVLHRLEQGLRFTAVNTRLITPLGASSAPAVRSGQTIEDLERPPGAKGGSCRLMRQECGGAVLHSGAPTEFVKTTAVCAADPMVDGIHRVLFTRHCPSYGACNVGVVRSGWNPAHGGWASATRGRSRSRWAWAAGLDDEDCYCVFDGIISDLHARVEMELDLSRGTLSAMPLSDIGGGGWRVIATDLRGPLCWMVELENGGDLVSIVSSPLVLSEKIKEEHWLQHAPTGSLKSRRHYDRRVREKLANRQGRAIRHHSLLYCHNEWLKAKQEQPCDARKVSRLELSYRRGSLRWRAMQESCGVVTERVPDASWGEVAANTTVTLRGSPHWPCNKSSGAATWTDDSTLEEGKEVYGTILATDMTGDDQTSQLGGSEVRLALAQILNARLSSASSVSRWAACDLLEMIAERLYVGRPAYLVYSGRARRPNTGSWRRCDNGGTRFNNPVWRIPCAELHDRLLGRDCVVPCDNREEDVTRARASSLYGKQEFSRYHGAYNLGAGRPHTDYEYLSSSGDDE